MARRYKNKYITKLNRTPFHFLKWFLGGYREKGYRKKDLLDFTYPERPDKRDGDRATWINHCTFLIEVEGCRILTDPIFSKRASPVQFCGPKRAHPPAIAIEDLGKIDAVIISHNHYDHLDAKSVKYLARKDRSTVWIIPKGVGRWFKRRGIYNFYELEWAESQNLELGSGLNLKFTATSAQHHSGRGLFDANKTLWMGVVAEFYPKNKEKKSLYFVGDSAYNPFEFRKIGKKFKGFHLMLCPIGVYHPLKFMQTVHMSPAEAVQVHKQVRAKQSIGMHFRTFHLSSEGMHEPMYDLLSEMKKEGLDPKSFVALEPGETLFW